MWCNMEEPTDAYSISEATSKFGSHSYLPTNASPSSQRLPYYTTYPVSSSESFQRAKSSKEWTMRPLSRRSRYGPRPPQPAKGVFHLSCRDLHPYFWRNFPTPCHPTGAFNTSSTSSRDLPCQIYLIIA